MNKLLNVVLATTLLTFSIEKTSFAHGWHSRVKTVCANRIKDKPKWKKGHYAIAQGIDGLHCFWQWGAKTKRYAEAQAMRGCKSRGHAPCKIMDSK